MLNFSFDLTRIRRFYEENEKTVRMAALIVVVGLSILFFWIHGDSRTHIISEGSGDTGEVTEELQSDEENGETDENNETKENGSVTLVYVDISGEVNDPGVYKVDSDTRLFEVIDMAGGLTENADPNSLNRAEKVWDGQKIIVLSYEDAGEAPIISSSSSSYSGTSDGSEKININTADSSELQNIPGIGPSKADAIIKYREENGYFSAPEDIMNVTGIGQKTFASIKDRIVV